MLIIDELKKGDHRLRALAITILAGLAVLLSGLFYVQVVAGKRFRASQVSQSFRTIRSPAVRGRILDTRGVPLADNRPAYNVNLYLEELRPHFQTAFTNIVGGRRLSRQERTELGRQARYGVVSNLVHRVGTLIDEDDALQEKQFHRHYDERLALPMSVFPDLNPAQVSRFVEQAGRWAGLELEVQPVRVYPQHTLAAHVLGYLQRDDRAGAGDLAARYHLPDFRGVSGIEASYDPQLRGTPGLQSVLVNNLGYRQAETEWVTAEPGRNVVLTLDSELQRAAEAALRSLGPQTRGAAVVMDPRTGDILALASSPTFDPNCFLPRLDPKTWDSLRDPVLLPLFNRATGGAYAPGSIFKIIIGLAGLETGLIDPDRLYHSPGYYLLGREGESRRIKDTANGGMPASFDFKRALKQSSNAYFIHYGLLIGVDQIVQFAQRLHLGEKSQLPVGPDVAGVLPTRAWRDQKRNGAWYEGDTANLSIGQGFITMTPVQAAVMTAAVANGGTVFWPRLVARTESAGRHTVEAIAQGRVRDHLGASERSLRIVREAMLADVEDADGTGHRAYIDGFRIAAKTGTAQVRQGTRMDHITWFVAFGPVDSPRYAVVVMIESGASGADTCAPLARQIFLAAQKQMNTRSQPSLAVAP